MIPMLTPKLDQHPAHSHVNVGAGVGAAAGAAADAAVGLQL